MEITLEKRKENVELYDEKNSYVANLNGYDQENRQLKREVEELNNKL